VQADPDGNMSNAAPIRILVVDDGELQDVREILAELDVPHAEARSFDARAIGSGLSLLVTNARHALDSSTPQPRSFVHLVVYDGISRALHKELRRSGCDLVLERPLNPHTFRLLSAQALYEGPERRMGRRVVLAAPVELHADGRTRPATLTQLSLRGCGLSTREAVKIGGEIELTLPPELTGGDPLRASGPVLSVRKPESGSDPHEVAVAFRLMDVASRRIVADIMSHHGSGAELRPRRAAHRVDAPNDDRRDSPRKRFTGRVVAAGAGISHMLIGRDLSSGGMRVRPEPDLEVGDEIKLAVYGRPGRPAIMLKAVVSRDDGEDGLVLRFRDVPTSIAARLEQIVSELPTLPVEERAGSPTGPGVVVSEILDRR
jgi:hypothetical protein